MSPQAHGPHEGAEAPREAPYEEVNIGPFAWAISLVEGKWKMHILFWLWKREVMRYGELKRALDGVTPKVLADKLHELEADGLVARTEYPQVPPKVEYRLTELGISFMPVLQALCAWGWEHMPDA